METYSIAPEGMGWSIRHDGERVGQVFDNCRAALDAARDAALSQWNSCGIESEIAVTDLHGERHRHYRYGSQD